MFISEKPGKMLVTYERVPVAIIPKGDEEQLCAVGEGDRVELRDHLAQTYSQHFGRPPYTIRMIGRWSSGFTNFLITCKGKSPKIIGSNMVKKFE